MTSTVLVTGGAGYIGSQTCKALARGGFRPVVYDDLSHGHAEAVRWGPFIRGDVRNPEALTAAMLAHRPCAIVHFAGLIEVGRSARQPDLFWDHNLNGTAAVLTAMRAAGVPRLVFSSTAACYGQPPGAGLEPLAETLPSLPVNPYGESKLAAERLIAASARAYGLSAIALRYFNAAGADPDGELGEAHQPETHLIPLAIEAALDFGPPLTIFGADFPSPDGSCLRDYVDVSDLADAHVRAITADVGPDGFAVANLGVGRGVSVLEVVETVGRIVGRPVPYVIGPRRVGDPAALVAAPGRAETLLGWTARRVDLDEIVRHAVQWRLNPRFGFAGPG